MSAQDIPHGQPGLRAGERGTGASAWLFASICPAQSKDLRRNGLVGVEFPQLPPALLWSRPMNPAVPRHVPVLGREAVDMLAPRAGGVYVDGTFGADGYSGMIVY